MKSYLRPCRFLITASDFTFPSFLDLLPNFEFFFVGIVFLLFEFLTAGVVGIHRRAPA